MNGEILLQKTNELLNVYLELCHRVVIEGKTTTPWDFHRDTQHGPDGKVNHFFCPLKCINQSFFLFTSFYVFRKSKCDMYLTTAEFETSIGQSVKCVAAILHLISLNWAVAEN